MPLESFRISSPLPASAARIYSAWLDAREHARMTGGAATVDPRVGGLFSAWDGYIAGAILELEPGQRIVQSWRTTEFSDDDDDSQIEVLLEPAENATKLTIRHTNVPDGHRSYENGGWQSNYFDPMREYFGSL